MGVRSSFAVVSFGCALALAVAAPAVQAQNFQNSYRPTGTRIVSQEEQADPDFARRLLKLTAACATRDDLPNVVSLLRGAESDAYAYAEEGIRNEDDHAPLRLSRCLDEAKNGAQIDVRMRIPARNLRLALAEEAYLARNAGPLAIAQGAPAVLAGRSVMLGNSPEQSAAIGIFADCLVYHAPAEADRLLRGPVGGDEERANARALVPAISQCLTPGQEANFSPTVIREFIADGLWARSEAMQAGGAGQ